MICDMQDKHGSLITDRKAIADIFADFYEQLYAKQHDAGIHAAARQEAVRPFTSEELQKA
eukprot:7339129-Karenia_brevis.AAC.1